MQYIQNLRIHNKVEKLGFLESDEEYGEESEGRADHEHGVGTAGSTSQDPSHIGCYSEYENCLLKQNAVLFYVFPLITRQMFQKKVP